MFHSSAGDNTVASANDEVRDICYWPQQNNQLINWKEKKTVLYSSSLYLTVIYKMKVTSISFVYSVFPPILKTTFPWCPSGVLFPVGKSSVFSLRESFRVILSMMQTLFHNYICRMEISKYNPQLVHNFRSLTAYSQGNDASSLAKLGAALRKQEGDSFFEILGF